VMRCPTHPTYKAIHKPRINCKPCIMLYVLMHE
jgi:hypothetical protein